MKRCIAFLSLLLVTFSRLPAAAPSGEAAKKPNILFLLADDWAWPDASCMGSNAVKTPTFDRIAKEGILFNNAHAAAPSCSPSRAAILTGQWHWRLEQGANLHGFIPAKFAVYPDILEQAGYFVGLSGKGYGPGSDEGHPHNPAGKGFKDFDAFIKARPAGQPFCFWFGSHQPHRPYTPGIGVRSGIDPKKITVPPYLPDTDITRNDLADYLAESQEFDRQCGQIIAALEKAGELDNTLIVITGDNGKPFPRAKAGCYDSGTHQPLAIRWGARVKGDRTVDDFVSLSDLAPTFLEAAGQPVPAAMTAKSLMPILLGAGSGQVDPARDHTLTGMERHVVSGRTDGPRKGVGYPMRSIITKDFHLIRNFKPERLPAGDSPAYPDCDNGPTKTLLVTLFHDDSLKRFAEIAFGKRPDIELYDLRKDPYELHNVAQDPAYARTLEDLENRLMTELKSTADPRTTGGGDDFDSYPPSPRQMQKISK